MIKCLGITDLSSLEAMACREVLVLALELSLMDVVIASDCQGVVNDIHIDTGGLYASIIKKINHTSK